MVILFFFNFLLKRTNKCSIMFWKWMTLNVIVVCVFVSSVESSSPSLLAPDNTLERSFFIRMKSTLTKRGVHIKSSGYKVSVLLVWAADVHQRWLVGVTTRTKQKIKKIYFFISISHSQIVFFFSHFLWKSPVTVSASEFAFKSTSQCWHLVADV